MALQNIGAGNRDDAFYRYKMPRMITKIEGRGNGIKTNVVNMVEIAKALARPPSYTTKYFGCELGAQSKFDEKSGTSLVNGAHETAKLAGLLENFIKKYVQCYGCGNPETDIITTKAQMIILKCAACGFLSDVDMRDKLTAFIIKNPPEPKKGSKDKKAMRRAEKERLKEGEAADEEQKKLKKEAARKKSSKEVASKANVKKAGVSDEEHSPTGSHNCGNGVIGGVDASADGSCEDDDDGGDGEVQWQTDTSAEAAHQRIREQLSAVTAGMVMLSAEDDDIKSKSEVEKSRKKQGKADSNGCCSETNIEDEIRSFLKKGCSPSQLKDFVATLSSSGASSSPQKILNALLFSLFDTCDGNLAKEVGKKKGYLAAVVQSESSQAHLLCALESFCTKFRPFSCVNEAAMAVKALYDGDVVEEEIVLEWYGQGSTGPNKYDAIWKDVKPFVDWLQSAESESE